MEDVDDLSSKFRKLTCIGGNVSEEELGKKVPN